MGESTQYFTLEQVKQHQSRSDLWIVVHGKVYDVTSFLEDHPGGEEIMLEQAGMDATTAFEDIGHSTLAKQQLDSFYIGELVKETDHRLKSKASTNSSTKAGRTSPTVDKQSGTPILLMVAGGLVLGIGAFAVYKLTK